jgi:hypothetical protein
MRIVLVDLVPAHSNFNRSNFTPQYGRRTRIVLLSLYRSLSSLALCALVDLGGGLGVQRLHGRALRTGRESESLQAQS